MFGSQTKIRDALGHAQAVEENASDSQTCLTDQWHVAEFKAAPMLFWQPDAPSAADAAEDLALRKNATSPGARR